MPAEPAASAHRGDPSFVNEGTNSGAGTVVIVARSARRCDAGASPASKPADSLWTGALLDA
jgi:hypothetical protein